MTRSILVLALCVAASAARADTVFPLGGSHPAAKALTRRLAKTIRAEVATRTIEDTATALACDLDDDGCLDSIKATLRADRIVYGTVAARKSEPGVVVRLMWVDDRGALEHVLVLDGDTTDALAEQLADKAKAIAGKLRRYGKFAQPAAKVKLFEADDDGGDVAASDREPAAPRRTPKSPRAPKLAMRSNTAAYALIGGGAAVMLVGAGVLVSAHSIATQVAQAPTATYDDFQHLLALETTGRARATAGGVLAVGGGAAAIAGGVWWYLNRGAREPKLVVRADARGAAVVFTARWR